MLQHHKIMPLLKVTLLASESSRNARNWDTFRVNGKKIMAFGEIALIPSSRAAVPRPETGNP
jgi:hypothetical protein